MKQNATMDTVWCRAQLRVIIRAITFIPKGWPIILNYDEYIKPDGSNPYFDSDSMFFFLKLLLLSLLLVVYPSPLISPLIFPPPLPSIPSSFPFVNKKFVGGSETEQPAQSILVNNNTLLPTSTVVVPMLPKDFKHEKKKLKKEKQL